MPRLLSTPPLVVTVPPRPAVVGVIEVEEEVTVSPDWETVTCFPRTVRWAVLWEPALPEKEKETTPLTTLLMVSQGWSLVGANTPVRFSVVGRMGTNWSLPAAAPSLIGVVF